MHRNSPWDATDVAGYVDQDLRRIRELSGSVDQDLRRIQYRQWAWVQIVSAVMIGTILGNVITFALLMWLKGS